MTDPGGVIDVDGTEVQVFPSTIIMVDANGELTDDSRRAVSGEVTETLPDGSVRITSFVNRKS